MRKASLAFATFLASVAPAWAAVDVNTATKEQLEAEGMGPVAAQALVDYRAKNGPFKSSDEVRRVIDEAIAKKLSIGISISGPSSSAPSPAPSSAASATPGQSATASAPSTEKAGESKPREDDDKVDNVRNRAKKDQDDRKT